MCYSQRSRRRTGGFTFIEIMAVVVILGILAGAVVLSVGHYTDKARVNRAKSDIATIVSALEAHYAEHARYPTNEERLKGLGLKNLLDSWGREYQYNSPGREGPYEVISFGADGREGGEGVDGDITSDGLDDQQD